MRNPRTKVLYLQIVYFLKGAYENGNMGVSIADLFIKAHGLRLFSLDLKDYLMSHKLGKSTAGLSEF